MVLKRLSDAIADNDRVLAVIRGSAVNQDGRSTVLAAPNGLAQQALVREALANAQLTPNRVGFVETHGTATPLGDPIEVEALAATIGAPRADGSLCYLGSAKASIGHLEAAAGVAGLIKTTLVLQHGEIPGQVHFTKLNPHLSLAGTCLAVADARRVWPPAALPRVAGVSGFGVGGTNAHVVVEEAPSLPVAAQAAVDEACLLPLSAQSPEALRALASAWLEFLPTTPESLAAVVSTAGARRSHYDHRLALVGRSTDQFETQLRAFLDGNGGPGVAVGRRPHRGSARIAFVFSGQGPQWPRMGRHLAEREPAFRDALMEVDARFHRVAGWSLTSALEEPVETSRLHETEIAQPAIFAIQVALVSLWRSWGIEPDAVVGHSIGEIAALHSAGVLSLDDAVRVVWHRGRIMQRATGLGRMAAAGLTVPEAESLVRDIGSALSIAAINGPRSVVLAGTADAVETALLTLDARGVSHRALPVLYAFHSAQMDPFREELVAAIGSIDAQPGRVAVFSTVTGAAINYAQVDAAYFGRNLRETVRFADAIHAILDSRVDAMVEIAPHPVLGSSVAECAAASEQLVPIVASMRRDREERETMLQACAGIYVLGRLPRWEALSPAEFAPVRLPAYPWQRERFWIRDRPVSVDGPRPAPTGARHALLGRRRETAVDGTVTYDGQWPGDGMAWLADHEVAGHIVMPGAALLEILRESARDALGRSGASLIDFVVHRPLVLDGPTAWSTVVVPEEDASRVELWTSGGTDAEGQLIASARARTSQDHRALHLEKSGLGDWRDGKDALYGAFAALGVRFGPEFRTLERWRVGDGIGEGWLAHLPHAAPARGGFGVHPTLLDGALQLCVLAATGAAPSALLLPIAVESYTPHGPTALRVRAEVRITENRPGGSVAASVRLFSEDDLLVASLDGVRLAPASSASLGELAAYHVRWRRMSADTPAEVAPRADGAWIVLTDGSATGHAIVAALTASGGRCLEVRTGPATGRDGETAWTIAQSDASAMHACLSDSSWRGGLPLRGIVHTWSLDAAPAAGVDDFGDWLTTGSALAMVQSLGESVMSVPLWFVTRGAQPATGTVSNPRAAGLWGLASVISLDTRISPVVSSTWTRSRRPKPCGVLSGS